MSNSSTQSLVNGQKIQLNGMQFLAEDANQPWSIDVLNANTVQFTVNPGDQWVSDPTTKSRAELESTTQIADSTPIDVSYGLAINTPNGTNNAGFTILGQFHADLGSTANLGPPFSIGLVGDHMVVQIGYVGLNGQPQVATLFTDSSAYVQNHVYNFDIKVTFDAAGAGHLVVTRDGIAIANYSGPLGWSDQSTVYWKEGIYRAESTSSLTATYSNLAISTGTTTTTPAQAQTPLVFNNYDNQGQLILSTTDNLDGSVLIKTFANGSLVRSELDSANGAKDIHQYGISGLSYTSTEAIYNVSGALTQWNAYAANGSLQNAMSFNADGTKHSSQSWNSDGSTTISTYGSNNFLATVEVDYANGSKMISTYGAIGASYVSDQKIYSVSGALSHNITVNGAGVTTALDYNTTGASYLIDRIVKAANGSMVSATYYHVDGTLSNSQTWNSDGSTTISTYNTAGVLTKTEFDAADGSKVFNDFGITGKTYVSDVRNYNASGILTQLLTKDAAGHNTSITQYHADGTLSFAETWNTNGSTTSNTCSATGSLIKTDIVQANGSEVIYDYGVTGQKYISDVRSYDTAHVMVQMSTTAADGSKIIADYTDVKGVAHIADYNVFDAKGHQTLLGNYNSDGSFSFLKTWNSDGSIQQNTYDTVGNMTKSELDYANNSKDIHDYGITGKTYTSDERIYDTSGTLTEMKYFNADGSSTDSHFGITGQAYTSDKMSYDAKHNLTALQQYHADGSLSFTETFGANGAATENFYDSTGHLTQTTAIQSAGTTQVTAFVSGLSLTGAPNTSFTSFGGDTFNFSGNFGNDTISNFHVGSGTNHDVISLSKAAVADFSHLSMAQQGSNVLITVDAHDTVVLQNVNLQALTASNFLFH